MEEVSEGIYKVEGRTATINLTRGKRVYGEKLIKADDIEYRLWNPRKSKLSAAISKGFKDLKIGRHSRVLYLGAASGTTVSHISDITTDGYIFAVESAMSPMKKLIRLSEDRKNIVPLYFDAHHPEKYAPFLEFVDLIYQDVAQKDQSKILLKNSDIYLKKGHRAILAVKAKSIDSAKKMEDVVSAEIQRLKPVFRIEEVVDLSPYERYHTLAVCRKK